MGAKYEPRDLEDAQKNFQVILQVKPGQGAYGFGETREEAVKNARYFLNRDWGSRRAVQKTTILRWDESSRSWVQAANQDASCP